MFRRPEEYFYLALLSKWERKAPPDKHWSRLDGKPAQNTQTARMARLLTIVTGLDDATMRKLERYTKRNDGNSYVSKNSSWMREAYPLGKGWYFEGNMSLLDKKKIIHSFPEMGISSREFASCAQDFVEGKSISKYWPSEEEAVRQIEQWEKQFPSGLPADLVPIFDEMKRHLE
jgi:hypothetical protein